MDSDNMNEVARMVVTEEVVLEKFEGTPEEGKLLERIYLTDGVMTKRQYFKNGRLVKEEVKEGMK